MKDQRSVKSLFQIRDWHVFNLEVENEVFSLEETASVDWSFMVRYDSSYMDSEGFYTCMLEMHFSALYKSGDRSTKVSGVAGTLFTMDAESPSEEMEKKTMNTARLNGMSFSILSLRNMLSQLSDNLGLEKKLIFPNINLTRFEFDKEYKISV